MSWFQRHVLYILFINWVGGLLIANIVKSCFSYGSVFSQYAIVALDSDELDFLEFANDIWSNRTICLETVTLPAQKVNCAAMNMYQTSSKYAVQ